ncbi:MAG TPA: head GIN domain-containing protein [Allosphingosinicella sp.]|nr:head GIN domain-containing protein [Allosphingosinicella sp.]
MISGFLLRCAGAALAACSVAAFAQQGGASGTTQRSYPVGTFDSVSAAGPHNVVVTVGGSPSVRAQGSADLLDRMEVVVEDGDLEIRPKREYRNNFRWGNQPRSTFYVTAPALKAASVAGSGDMKIDRIQGDRFSGAVAGSGKLDVASLRVSRASFSIAGSGDVSARGSAGDLDLSVAGSGNLRLREVASQRASVSIAGSGNVDLNAADTAKVSIIGSGDVSVAGTARCTVSKIGAGRVNCAR